MAIEPLPKEIERLFEAARAPFSPPSDLADRVWQRLLERNGTAWRPSPARPLARGSVRLLALGAAGFLIGGIGGVAIHRAPLAEERPAVIAPLPQPLAPPDAREPTTSSARDVTPWLESAPPDPEDRTEPEAREKRKIRRNWRSPVSSAPEPLTNESLAEESRLLEMARRAIAGGDPLTAREQIGAYRTRFPQGVLREEAEFFDIQADAKLSSGGAGLDRVQAFVKKYPRSIFVPEVKALAR
jgi:hypothetical protein